MPWQEPASYDEMKLNETVNQRIIMRDFCLRGVEEILDMVVLMYNEIVAESHQICCHCFWGRLIFTMWDETAITQSERGMFSNCVRLLHFDVFVHTFLGTRGMWEKNRIFSVTHFFCLTPFELSKNCPITYSTVTNNIKKNQIISTITHIFLHNTISLNMQPSTNRSITIRNSKYLYKKSPCLSHI